MPNHITADGPTGQIRWSYMPALTFGRWRYDGTGHSGTLTSAQVLDCDEFRLRQSPLVVVVPMGRAEWRWSVDAVQVSGETVTVTVSRL
jgi:hypothetical protein